ncbi:MAG: hypothetical protein IKJ01_07405 [Lachnospiraceae bacterium]|nr:hypothetical protein [Lachnospiraceae bacterium]
MKEVFQEYGGIIITVIAILALIAVIQVIVGDGETGIISEAFQELIEDFMKRAELGKKN